MNNSYSISKTTAERFALMFNKEHGTKIAIVRGLNAYGPRQKSEPVRKIMPNFVIPALRDESITIYGDGSQVMDMIYVADLAEILVRALVEDHGVYDRVFEAGTGRKTTVLDIANEVIKQANGGYITTVPMRPGEPEQSVVLGDPETLKPLGEINLTTLEEGIAKTIAWYRENL
jgi:nucleoside-diphosphate-sugar epimerase